MLLDIWKTIPFLRFPNFACLSFWFWSTVRIMDGGENRSTVRITCPVATLSSINLTWILFQDSVPTLQWIHPVSNVRTRGLMLFSEIVPCCSQNQKKHKHTESTECRNSMHLTNCSKRIIIQYSSLNLRLICNIRSWNSAAFTLPMEQTRMPYEVIRLLRKRVWWCLPPSYFNVTCFLYKTKQSSLSASNRREGGGSDIGVRRRGLLRVVAITTANT